MMFILQRSLLTIVEDKLDKLYILKAQELTLGLFCFYTFSKLINLC
jgi:hypothetical protein